jgi:membrane protein
MAAALSYYSIFVGGPVLVLTLQLGSVLFGADVTTDTLAQLVRRGLPPGVEGASELAERMVRMSAPTASLALVAGLFSLLSFTRALATCLNVTLRAGGTEPFYRPFVVGPLLLLAVLGLLWGSWAFSFLVNLLQASTGQWTSWLASFLLEGLAPFVLATFYFAAILVLVPRPDLSGREILVPAVLGAALWEAARHIFGALMGADSAYLRIFGPLGGVVALLSWVYLSSTILVLTGQFTWAFAMERRGRGRSASMAPREAGLTGWIRPFHGYNPVNEDYAG